MNYLVDTNILTRLAEPGHAMHQEALDAANFSFVRAIGYTSFPTVPNSAARPTTWTSAWTHSYPSLLPERDWSACSRSSWN